MIVSMLPWRYAVVSRSLFDFSVIPFALDLVGYALKPLRDNPAVQSLLAVSKASLLDVVSGQALPQSFNRAASLWRGWACLGNQRLPNGLRPKE